MEECMEYKGYTGTIQYSKEDKCFYGKVLNVQHLLTYEGLTRGYLRMDFEKTVDEYLDVVSRHSGQNDVK